MASKFDHVNAFSRKKLNDSLQMLGKGIKASPVVFTIVLITTIIDAALSSSLPLIIKELIIATQNQDKINDYFWIFKKNWVFFLSLGGVIFFFIIIFEFLANYSALYFAKKMEIYLRNQALKKLVDLDMNFYFDNQIGLIMSRVITDTEGVGLGFNDFLMNSIYFVTTFISSCTMLFIINKELGFIGFAYVLILIISTWVFFIYYRRAILISVDLRQHNDADMIDRIMNIRLIKSSGTELYEAARTVEMQKKYDKAQTKAIQIQTSMNIFNVSLASVFPILIIILSIFLIDDKSQLPSIITPAVAIGYQLQMSIMWFPQVLRGATKLSNCVMRLNKIFDAKELIDRKIQDGDKIDKIDKIEFKNLDFSYPNKMDKEILNNLNFVFEQGKSYAFVGETGSGKSTIAKLLLRFYDPKNGEILINGVNLKTLNLSSYLSNVGYVEQEPQILYGTIKENIKYGSFEADDDKIIESAKKAKIHKFILTLPDGYETIVGERGFMLSGGQKQRLVIARMFLQKPQLIILDEATSALDNIVEKQIQKELDKLMQGRTSVSIAHRLSTIKNVDKIFVLSKDNGIAQVGTYDKLSVKKGIFKNLVDAE